MSQKRAKAQEQLILAEIPYADRQLIVVADDEIVAAERKAETEESDSKQAYWTNIAIKTLRILAGSTAAFAEVAVDAIKAWNELRQKGINVLSISRTESSSLQFPPGHPRDGILYIGHPGNPLVYYTTAQFHRMTFEHKFAEAIHLLMALGASKIDVKYISGWSREFSTSITVPLGQPDIQVGGSAGNSQGSKTQLLFTAELDGTASPEIPKMLVWYPHEPAWQKIAEGRVKYGLRNFSLSVRYEDDFGVHAGLKVAAQKAGLDLGGKFEGHQSTVWEVSGTFK
jgi:hypothetical protein